MNPLSQGRNRIAGFVKDRQFRKYKKGEEPHPLVAYSIELKHCKNIFLTTAKYPVPYATFGEIGFNAQMSEWTQLYLSYKKQKAK